MGRYITRHVVTSRDPHALQLLNPSFVLSLFGIIMDNCAPVTGITRYDYASEDAGDGGGGCGTDDLVEFLALLAPEVSLSVFCLKLWLRSACRWDLSRLSVAVFSEPNNCRCCHCFCR